MWFSFVGLEIDRLAETKGASFPMMERWQQILIRHSPGLDAWDRERAERHAKDSSRNLYDQHYIDQNGADQYAPNQYEAPQHFQY